MRRRRSIFKRVNKNEAYNKTTLEGIIIYIDDTDGWCNIELADATVLYRIQFGEGVNTRLKRVEQPVTLVQTVGKRYRYIVVGASRRYIASSEFASKGTGKYNASLEYNDRQVYG